MKTNNLKRKKVAGLFFMFVFLSNASFAQNDKQYNNHATYWKSVGYGLMAQISSDTLQLYGATGISLVPSAKLLMKENYLFLEDFSPVAYSITDSTLTIRPGSMIVFDRIDSFPSFQYTGYTNDPRINFEVFWQTYKENFSLFDLSGTDWDLVYSAYSPLVLETTGDETLFNIFSEMLAPLKDGHSYINNAVEEWYYTPGPPADLFWINDWEIMIEDIQYRLDGQEFGVTANGLVLYGKIDNKIGYIIIGSMGGFAPYEEFVPDKEIISRVMDDLTDEFADCDGIIVDIRLNGGGDPVVSLEIASKFNDQSRVAFSYDFRNGGYNDFSERNTEYTYTSDKNFGNKPVVLLTSNFTKSAADQFAMIMKDIPDVTLLGEKTYGIFSMYLGVNLPNKWEIGYSMQRVFDANGICYEQSGIQPDVEVKQDSSYYYNGIDNVLESAIDMLKTSDIHSITSDNTILKVYTDCSIHRTVAEVYLPENETGVLLITDITGRIIENYYVRGKNKVEWNNEKYGRGVFICTLKTGSDVQSIKYVAGFN